MVARQGRTLGRRPAAPASSRAADMAIAAARRAAGPGEPALIRVADVREVAMSHFGHRYVSHPEAAAALRERYERARCARDSVTDAYDGP